MPTEHIRNPQTEALLDMLKLPYNLEHRQQQQQHQEFNYRPTTEQERLLSGSSSKPLPPPPERPVTDAQVVAALSNPEEIDLGEEDDGDDGEGREKDGGAGGAGGVDQDDPMFQPL